jgi:hypothetical protein
VRPGLTAFLAFAVLPLAACGSSGGAEWAGPPRPDDNGQLRVGGFNDYLDEQANDAASPVVASTRFLRLDRVNATTTSLEARATAEGSGPTTVTVTLDRLADDSVRAQRYVLSFTRDGDEWRLTSAAVTQRCWPNRGHPGFSTEPCV